MKLIPLSLAGLCLASMLCVHFAGAQDVQTVYGNRHANTVDDLKSAVTKFPYTWELPTGKSSVTFNQDGTGKQTAFNFTWSTKNPQQIELSRPGSAMKAIVIFSSDYTTFTGVDFEAHPLRGSVVLPKAAEPTPPPTIAAGTPAAGGVSAAGAAPTAAPVLAPGATPTPANPFFNRPATTGNDPLIKAITGTRYSWEHETGTNKETVIFAADGTGRQTFFDITWRAKNPHELEIAIKDDKSQGKIILKFNGDFTKYTATDFDGESSLRGHKVQ